MTVIFRDICKWVRADLAGSTDPADSGSICVWHNLASGMRASQKLNALAYRPLLVPFSATEDEYD
jgi:hypothetical protein